MAQQEAFICNNTCISPAQYAPQTPFAGQSVIVNCSSHLLQPSRGRRASPLITLISCSHLHRSKMTKCVHWHHMEHCVPPAEESRPSGPYIRSEWYVFLNYPATLGVMNTGPLKPACFTYYTYSVYQGKSRTDWVFTWKPFFTPKSHNIMNIDFWKITQWRCELTPTHSGLAMNVSLWG